MVKSWIMGKGTHEENVYKILAREPEDVFKGNVCGLDLSCAG
jgi:hypothetical protein